MNNNLSFYSQKTVLVTGANGYIASRLVQQLAEQPCRLRRLVGPKAALQPIRGAATVEDYNLDFCDPTTWATVLPNVDVIFHCAWQTSAYIANANPLADWQTNIQPLLLLLSYLNTHTTTTHVIFPSSATVYGDCGDAQINENHPTTSASLYELHKIMAEQYLKHYTQLGAIHCAVLRLTNVYGPSPHGTQKRDRGVLHQMIKKAIQGEPLTIYNSGKYLRDYVYLDDVIHAMLLAGQYAPQANGQCYNIGSGKGIYFADMVKKISQLVEAKLGHSVMLQNIPAPDNQLAIEKRHFHADCTQIKQLCGWEATVSAEQGLAQTLDSFLKND